VRILDFYMTGLKSGAVLHFPTVHLNDGNGYDVTSGFFTAPVAGTYVFFLRFATILLH
jgi:hypothetical protein